MKHTISYHFNLAAQTEQQILAEDLIQYIKKRRRRLYPLLNDARISKALYHSLEIWDDKPRRELR